MRTRYAVRLWVGVCCLALASGPARAQDAAAWRKDVEDAKVAYHRKDYARSEQLLQAAMQEAMKFGSEDPRVAVTLHNQANLAAARNHPGEAEALFRKALSLLEKVRGAEHPQTALAQLGLADFLTGQGRYPEAEANYRHSLANLEKVLGPHHLIIATVLDRYGSMLRRDGRVAEAEPLEARARTIRSEQPAATDRP
jgi:tetratricopeptide (TPR) repeat protein